MVRKRHMNHRKGDEEAALQIEVDRIWSQGDSIKAIAISAAHLAEKAVHQLQKGEYAEGFFKGHIADRLYNRLASIERLSRAERLQLKLAGLKTKISESIGLRRKGNLSEALELNQTTEGALQQLSQDVLTLEKKDERVVFDWYSTVGALLLNKGVVLTDLGKRKMALETWIKGENFLFDRYIKIIGPEADLECTAKVINLWENKFVAAAKIEEWELAANDIFKALKVVAWWLSQKREVPRPVHEALGSLVAQVGQLQPQQRQKLDTHLHPEVKSVLNRFLK